MTNPILLVEILSPSTESKDRGRKWRGYQTIPTLRHYLMVSSAEMRVEIYTRTDDNTWQMQTVEDPEGELALAGLGISVPVAGLYDLVDFDGEQ